MLCYVMLCYVFEMLFSFDVLMFDLDVPDEIVPVLNILVFTCCSKLLLFLSYYFDQCIFVDLLSNKINQDFILCDLLKKH